MNSISENVVKYVITKQIESLKEEVIKYCNPMLVLNMEVPETPAWMDEDTEHKDIPVRINHRLMLTTDIGCRIRGLYEPLFSIVNGRVREENAKSYEDYINAITPIVIAKIRYYLATQLMKLCYLPMNIDINGNLSYNETNDYGPRLNNIIQESNCYHLITTIRDINQLDVLIDSDKPDGGLKFRPMYLDHLVQDAYNTYCGNLLEGDSYADEDSSPYAERCIEGIDTVTVIKLLLDEIYDSVESNKDAKNTVVDKAVKVAARLKEYLDNLPLASRYLEVVCGYLIHERIDDVAKLSKSCILTDAQMRVWIDSSEDDIYHDIMLTLDELVKYKIEHSEHSSCERIDKDNKHKTTIFKDAMFVYPTPHPQYPF